MCNDKRKRLAPKLICRVRGLAQHIVGLIARGHVTVRINENVLTLINAADPVGRSGPQVYQDAPIHALVTLKLVQYSTLRAALSFAQSLQVLQCADP